MVWPSFNASPDSLYTQEEGLRQETHLKSLSKRLLFMHEMLMMFPFRLPVPCLKGTADGKLE